MAGSQNRVKDETRQDDTQYTTITRSVAHDIDEMLK